MTKIILCIFVLLMSSPAFAGNNTQAGINRVFTDDDLVRYRGNQQTSSPIGEKYQEETDRGEERNVPNRPVSVDRGIADLLKSKWKSYVELLKKGQTANALHYICPMMRSTYTAMFKALGANIKQISATQVDLEISYTTENMAKGELTTNEKGELFSYEVMFAKDLNGDWCISQY